MVRAGIMSAVRRQKQLKESNVKVKGIPYKGTLKPLTEEEVKYLEDNHMIKEETDGRVE